jgi:hypothetical protein
LSAAPLASAVRNNLSYAFGNNGAMSIGGEN